jgi:hypothetical protein
MQIAFGIVDALAGCSGENNDPLLHIGALPGATHARPWISVAAAAVCAHIANNATIVTARQDEVRAKLNMKVSSSSDRPHDALEAGI